MLIPRNERDGEFTSPATARYEVKYINDKKELVTITCAKDKEIPEEKMRRKSRRR